MKKFKKNITLFFIMGIVYMLLEVFFRAFMSKSLALKGWSSLWMILVGGFSCYIIGLFNEKCRLPIKLQCVLGSVLISLLELGTGYVFNIKFSYGLWEYYTIPLNICGQVSLLFSIIWIGLIPIGAWVDDVVRFYMFDEEKPVGLSGYYKRLFSLKWE